MAEGIAISLSAKLGVALSRSAALGFSSLFGVRSDMAAANQDLVLLRAFLQYADSRHGTDALAAEWVKQVRDVAFDLEDVADECCYLSASGHGLAHDMLNVRAWHSLSRRLRKARERLRLLTAAKEQYGIRPPNGNGPASPAAPLITIASSRSLAERAHFFEKEDVVGFAAQEAQLLEWVVGDDDSKPQRTLVAVCGMGGVGKTTLVTRVYKEVLAMATNTSRSHFDCTAWVCVSQDFTVDDLLKKMLKELCRDASSSGGGNDTGAELDYRSLLEAVRRNLGKRRYLVVLDDVWDAQLWNKHLRLAFLDEANGSRVVITTRSGEVAKAATAERTMALDPLPRHHAWTLFCKVAFRDVPSRTCPSHLEELANNMLRRCGGLPLAIVSVGNLLALKEGTEFAWRNASDSLVWDKSGGDLGIGEAASVLNLSIDDLPHHLKKCFLSCSIYPEDLWINRKVLIRRWVALGFVQDRPGYCTAEDVADDYLDQLVQRNLMRPVIRNEFGRAKRCLIHDLFRELIINKSRQEEGLCLVVNPRISVGCNDRIRHLAIDRCEQVDCQNVQQMSTIRSFNAFGSELGSSSLSHFRLLTELNIWFITIKRLPHSVTSLHNLRYLGIRSTLIEELPKELGKLQKLQILDAKLSMVQRLPSSITQLKCLRHLIVLTRETTNFLRPYPSTAVEVPAEGLENLTGLQTLKYVQAHTNMVKSLARLEQMRSLDLSEVKMNLMDDLSMSISRMRCLLSLGLRIEPGEDAVLDLDSISPPPLKLQKLVLVGRLANGKLPLWTCYLTSLVQISLCGSQIAQDSLVLLGELPRLGNLSLIRAYRERSMIFVEGSFPNLCKLTLEHLSFLNQIVFQEDCLVNLRDLVLGNCTELTEAPEGMENLMRIENLDLFGMSAEFVNKLKGQNGDAGYQNPANSEFQTPDLLRFVRFVKAKRTSEAHDTMIVNICTNSNTSLASNLSGPCWKWTSGSLV